MINVLPFKLSTSGDIVFSIDNAVPKDELVFNGITIFALNLNGQRIVVTPSSVRDLKGKNADFETDYTGTVGKNLKVEMRLTESGRAGSDRVPYKGSYFYLSDRQHLTISGSGPVLSDYYEPDIDAESKDLRFTLIERDHGKKTGEFNGRCIRSRLSGTWTSADGKRKLPFSLLPRSVRWAQ